MTNLDYNVQADNLKCKHPEQNVEKSRSLVERARLEIVYTPQGYRGFESLLLRHTSTVIQSNYGGLFCLILFNYGHILSNPQSPHGIFAGLSIAAYFSRDEKRSRWPCPQMQAGPGKTGSAVEDLSVD